MQSCDLCKSRIQGYFTLRFPYGVEEFYICKPCMQAADGELWRIQVRLQMHNSDLTADQWKVAQ